MRYFLLTCCVVMISARPEGGYRYDPPTAAPNPLSCCHKLAILTRGSGGQSSARIVNGHTSGYTSGYPSNTVSGGQTSGGYSKSGYSSGYTSGNSGYTSGSSGYNAGGGHGSGGYTTGGVANGYVSGGQATSHAAGGYTTNSASSGYTSGGTIGGHSGQTLGPITNALSQTLSSSGYITGSLSSGHSAGSTTGHHLSGSTGGLASNHLSGSSSGVVSSGHGATTGLTSGSSSGHSIASGLVSGLTSSGLSGSSSSASGSSYVNHQSSANRGSSVNSQGFVGGSGGGASFTPNTFSTVGSAGDGGELDGSASSGSFSSAVLGGAFSDQSGFDAGFSGAGTSTVNIQKHIYVHVPPPDDEEAIMRAKYEALLTPKKHYKIIFIKAPSAPSFPTAQLLANAGAQEEKTLVYVLVKKPEEPTMGDIKAAQAAIHPSKPEVYFIKYKTREAPANSLAGAASLGSDAFAGTDLSQYSLANHQFSSSYSSSGGLADTVSITTEVPSAAYGAPVPPSTVYGTK